MKKKTGRGAILLFVAIISTIPSPALAFNGEGGLGASERWTQYNERETQRYLDAVAAAERVARESAAAAQSQAAPFLAEQAELMATAGGIILTVVSMYVGQPALFSQARTLLPPLLASATSLLARFNLFLTRVETIRNTPAGRLINWAAAAATGAAITRWVNSIGAAQHGQPDALRNCLAPTPGTLLPQPPIPAIPPDAARPATTPSHSQNEHPGLQAQGETHTSGGRSSGQGSGQGSGGGGASGGRIGFSVTVDLQRGH